MNEKRTCHPYGVLNFEDASYGYKHIAPLALTDMYDNTIAAEQRYVYRKNKSTTQIAP